MQAGRGGRSAINDFGGSAIAARKQIHGDCRCPGVPACPVADRRQPVRRVRRTGADRWHRVGGSRTMNVVREYWLAPTPRRLAKNSAGTQSSICAATIGVASHPSCRATSISLTLSPMLCSAAPQHRQNDTRRADSDLIARQMIRQVLTLRASYIDILHDPRTCSDARDIGFDIFQSKRQLVRIRPLRPAAELRALQLLDDGLQALNFA